MKTPDQIIGPALDRMYALRPKSFQHLNLRTGNYWYPFASQRACAALALARVSVLLSSNRLSATGQDLLDYVESEYTPLLAQDKAGTFAQGEVVLTRPPLDDAGNPATLVAGDVPKGSRFLRPANLTTQIPFSNAEYETTADYHFNAGQLVSLPIPIQATTSGAAANHPVRLDTVDPKITVSGRGLFDTSLVVTAFSAAGGSAPFNPGALDTADFDKFLRQYALAYSNGQYGPTKDAALLGAIAGTGGRHVITFDDVARGVLKVQVADSSWGASTRWASSVRQAIYDAKQVGFGCVVEVIGTRNRVVSVEASVTLRDWGYTSNTGDIDDAVRAAVQSYWDDRPDWNVWKLRALRNAITRAHAKILKCSTVTVRDITGAVVPEIATPDYTTEQFHLYLPAKAVTTTYVGPS